MRDKSDKLFDCVVKSILQDMYLPDLEAEILQNMQDLLESFELLDERMQMNREQFDKEMPEIVKQ